MLLPENGPMCFWAACSQKKRPFALHLPRHTADNTVLTAAIASQWPFRGDDRTGCIVLKMGERPYASTHQTNHSSRVAVRVGRASSCTASLSLLQPESHLLSVLSSSRGRRLGATELNRSVSCCLMRSAITRILQTAVDSCSTQIEFADDYQQI